MNGGDSELLAQFKEKTLLIYTERDYSGLNQLYDRYHDKGLEIIVFPCNQFGEQEPGTDREIFERITKQYSPKYFISKKVNVNGPEADPLFVYLKSKTPQNDLTWNFAKFIISPGGYDIDFFEPASSVEVSVLQNRVV
ncbi:hypothetical protein Ciccas_009494 [Cichlidogyrus casuarinus]|uniref:Glutathione peroxidase n=1 Tax=Cichlidogyrus casuarinus TaxID=1844966 RepID=A0ABD2PWU5_9PLAT